MGNFALAIILFIMVVSVFGISHINMSDADKANLATKPMIYQKFIQFCRVGWIVLAIGCLLYIAGQGMMKSHDHSDCIYDTQGEDCGPG
jgi:hypothetical protein